MIPDPPFTEDGKNIDDLVSIEILDQEGCPRYGAVALEDIEVKGSPAEVRARLRLAGLRPINNVVDITNLVLFETGHPLHPFDLDKLAGSKIVVRRALAGEKMTGIDDRAYELAATDLVIADTDRPVAIAGVIGGKDTQVTDRTRRVLIEGAFFDRSYIWRTSKRLGVDTDASYRFARVVDVGAVLYVLARTASILQRQTGCKVSKGMADIYPKPAVPVHIYVNPKRVNSLIGTSIPEQEICDYLERLGFLVSPGRELEVVVPSRRSDVTCEADIAEEIARLHGYDRIGETTGRSCEAYGRSSSRDWIYTYAKSVLTGLGLTEVVTDSMVGPQTLKLYGLGADETIEIRNPVGVENSLLRPALVPGIIDVLVANEHRGQDRVGVFELGKVYYPTDGGLAEAYRLAVGLSGLREPRSWYTPPREYDFYDTKGMLESLAAALDLTLCAGSCDLGILHPGRSAWLRLGGTSDEYPKVGYLGQVTTGISDALGSRRRLYVAELDFEPIAEAADRTRRFSGLPRFPAVKRDLAVVVSENVPESRLRELIRTEGGALVESVELFDVYQGEQIPAGTKSLAYAIIFRSPSKTLKEGEVDDLQKSIERKLNSEFGGTIRARDQHSNKRG
jgi:phenylalanyl-tRNA synthetase beta chain